MRFVSDALRKPSKWQKKIISFYEDSGKDEYLSFFKRFSKIVSQLFELIFRAWKKSRAPDHRTYLQGPRTFTEIRRVNKRKLNVLNKSAAKIISNAIQEY